MRTFEEKAAIVEHCIELEKTGGDILGYLWSQNYYTPRATWCNFQREWLHRKPYEYTDGKPKKKGEAIMKSKFIVTPEIRDEAIRIAINGGDPRNYLTGMGSQNGMSSWTKILMELKKTNPEKFAKLPKRIGKAEVPEAPEMPTLKVDGPLKIETPEGNTIKVAELPEIIDGVTKEITVHEADMFEVPEGMVPLHMLEHPVKVNIVKDEPKITQPVCYDGMTVREIEGLFGRYRRTDINGATYIDFENPDGADILSYTVDQWRKMRVEQANAFRILGVEL